MTPERYDELQSGVGSQQLTPEEFEAGWHWCLEMDDLLCLLGSEDCFCQHITDEMRQHAENIAKQSDFQDLESWANNLIKDTLDNEN